MGARAGDVQPCGAYGCMARQVRIMKEWDPTGKQGPKQPMPDLVTVLQPKDEEPISDKPSIGAPQRAAGRMGHIHCKAHGHALRAWTLDHLHVMCQPRQSSALRGRRRRSRQARRRRAMSRMWAARTSSRRRWRPRQARLCPCRLLPAAPVSVVLGSFAH